MIIPRAALREIEHLLPPEMVAAEALQAARAMADSLPDAMSAYGLEMRLDAPAGALDLAGAVRQSDGTIQSFSAFMRRRARDAKADDPVWHRLDSFFMDWSNPESLLHSNVSHAWLEYDLSATGDTLRHPGVFVAFHEDTLRRDGTATKEVIERTLLHLLGNQGLARARADQLLNLRAQFPKNAEIVHIGIMLSRAENTVRMVFRVGSENVITDFLEKVHWPGSADEISKWLNQSRNALPPNLIHLEVGNRLTPRIDIEYRTAGLPRKDCIDFLGVLVSSGLCCASKEPHLENWVDWSFLDWPDLSPAVIWRTLHHFKLSFKPQNYLIAKAYLWVGAAQHPVDWLAAQATGVSRA